MMKHKFALILFAVLFSFAVYGQPTHVITDVEKKFKEAKELFDDWKDQYIKETQALQRQTDLERQLQELRTELRENKKESSTDRVIKRLEPYIEPIVGKIFDMDINANTTSVGTTAEAVDLETAIKSLHEIEPDTAIIVAKLAALKKNNEANYNMAKNMLMAQS